MTVYRHGNEFFPSEKIAREITIKEVVKKWNDWKGFCEEHSTDFKMLTNVEEKIKKNGNKTIHTFIFYYQCRMVDQKLHTYQSYRTYTAIEV